MTRSSTQRRVASGATRLRRLAVSLFLCGIALALFTAIPATTRAQTAKPTPKRAAAKSESCLAPIKDFVNKDTLAVARVSLDQVDAEQLAQTLEGAFSQALALFEFPSASESSCLKEFHKTIAALQADVKLAQSEFLKEYGASEAFVVLQTLRGDGACLIIPVQGISESQLASLKALVKERLKLTAAVYQKKYLIASQTPLKEIGAFYQSFTPGANEKLEDFFRQHQDKLFAAYVGRVKIRPLLHSTSPTDEEAKTGRIRQYDPFANSPQSVKTLVEVFDSSFISGSAYVDLSTLSANCKLTFNTPASAGQFRDSLSDSIETFNSFYFKLLEGSEPGTRSSQFAPGASLARRSKATATKYYMYQWTRDVWTGRMRRYLPTQDQDSLVFSLSLQNEIQKLGINTIAVWLYTTNTDLVSPMLLGRARGVDTSSTVPQSPFVLTTKARKRTGELNANPFESNVVEEAEAAPAEQEPEGNPFENVVADAQPSESSKQDDEIVFDENDPNSTASETKTDQSNVNPFEAGVESESPSGEDSENPFDTGLEDSENPFDAGLEEGENEPGK